MFTGIIQAVGHVQAVAQQPGGIRLTIDRSAWHPEDRMLAIGESVAVSGVCLTVVERDDRRVSFDVITETLSLTTVGRWTPGTPVNLESALAAGSPVGGHFVQGHVDALGRVEKVQSEASETRITVRPLARPPVRAGRSDATLQQASGATGLADPMLSIVPKGSIAVDGVSLTVAAVAPDQFDVALIPTTLKSTTLGGLAVGDHVNLETDMITRSVVHYLQRQTAAGDRGVSMQQLRQAGFA